MADEKKSQVEKDAEAAEAAAEKDRERAAKEEAKEAEAVAKKEEARKDEVDVVAAAIASVERDRRVPIGDPLAASFTVTAKAVLDALDDFRAGGPEKRRKNKDGLTPVGHDRNDPVVTGAEVDGGTKVAINPGDGLPTTGLVYPAAV